MATVKVHNVDLYYEIHGPKSGRPITLLHHDGMSSDVWRTLLPYLTPAFRVLMFDRPGHGRSAVPPDHPSYTVERGAATLGELLEKVGIEQPILFGASGGALIALEYALNHPLAVPLLIFAEPPLHGLATHFAIDRCGYSAARFADVLQRDGMEAMVRCFLGTIFPPARVAQILRSAAGRAMINMAPHVLLQALRADEEYSPSERLRDVSCMTIVLTGQQSTALFKSVERVLTTQIPFCMSIALPRADHANLLAPTPHLLRALAAIATTSTDTAMPETAMFSSGLLHLQARVQRVPMTDMAAPVHVSIQLPLGRGLVTRRVLDLSPLGFSMALEPGDHLPSGWTLSRFALKLPNTTIVARGVVRRVRESRGAAGIEITSMPSKDRAILGAFVEELERMAITTAKPSNLAEIVSVLEQTGSVHVQDEATEESIAAYVRFRERLLDDAPSNKSLPRLYDEEDENGASDRTDIVPLNKLGSRRTYPCVVIVGGERSAGKLFRLKDGMTIGRALSCDIALDEAGISRCHARVRMTSEGTWLDDAGSRNGLEWHGKRVSSVPLREGERVRIGDAAFYLVQMDDLKGTLRWNLLEDEREAPSRPALGAELLLLVARSGSQIEATAELLRESESTWLLQNVGVLPSARLTPPELVVELISRVERLESFGYIHAMLRIEEGDAMRMSWLLSSKPVPDSFSWREWAQVSAPLPHALTCNIRRTLPTDADWLDATLKATFHPVEVQALALTPTAFAAGDVPLDDQRIRIGWCATTEDGRSALAICDRAMEGQGIGGRKWIARVVPQSARDVRPVADLVAHLHRVHNAGSGGADMRILVPTSVASALVQAGFERTARWIEAVTDNTFAGQMTNLCGAIG